MLKIPNNFHHVTPYTIGIEEEYMLCDPITGDLINKADDIMNSLKPDLKERYSYELILSEIEINTSVSDSVSDAINEIIFLRNNTKLLGEELGFCIGVSGTHPTAICKDQIFVDNESYNWVSNQLNYYAKRNITFASHVHVAVDNAECAIHVSNSLRRWIAPLLALTTNSPFFEGHLTGLRSSRSFQFGTFPRTNIPIYFKNFKEYKNLINNYLLSNTIEKPRHIWWKIRPHIDYGTIEFRICDMQRKIKNVEMVVALSQALVYQAVQDYHNSILVEDFNTEYLNDALWKSIRFPLNSKIIDPINNKITTINEQIDIMCDYIYKSLETFNTSHILNTVKNIALNGTECDEQIEIYNKDGFKGLKKYLIAKTEYKLPKEET